MRLYVLVIEKLERRYWRPVQVFWPNNRARGVSMVGQLGAANPGEQFRLARYSRQRVERTRRGLSPS